MKALLLGSIGALSDTSELQREAFNAAFSKHGLNWSWDRETYRKMLRTSGGQARITAQAEAEGIAIDAAAIHATKSELFQTILDAGRATPRPGVTEAIAFAQTNDLKLGFISTTSRANIDSLLAGIDIAPGTFDLITSDDDVASGKPAPDVFHFAAERLGVSRADCTVIEDNTDGVRAAQRAGMTCIAWPNANTADHDFGDATIATGNLFETLFTKTVASQ